MLRTYPAHEEGGEREWQLETYALEGDAGRVAAPARAPRRVPGLRRDRRRGGPAMPGGEVTLDVDLVLVAIGFTGVETRRPALRPARRRARARAARSPVDAAFATARRGVFAAGDCVRGADLIVQAIADGREAARSVDLALQGASALPEPRRRLSLSRSWRFPRIPAAQPARAPARAATVLSDAWYMLRRATFDYQGRDGTWTEQHREVYDRGNGATILLRDETRDTVLLTRQFRCRRTSTGTPTAC